MTTTIETLREQHQAVLARFDAMEAGLPGDLAALRELLAFLRTDLLEHFALEEEALFPVLARHPHLADGPVAVMEAEHHECHALMAEMAVASRSGNVQQLVATVRLFIALLRAHIDKEDHVLFPLAARALSDAEREEIEVRAAAWRRQSSAAPEPPRGRRRDAPPM